MVSYWHTLSPGAVSALVKTVKAVHFYGRNRVHIHDEMKGNVPPEFRLSDFEWNNYSCLRFHGLVAHADKDERRSGYWLITARGGQFLRGDIKVPARVRTFRDQVIEHGTELIGIDDFKGKVPEFEREKAWETERVEAPSKSIPLFA
jgi:hypothetical protein